MFVESIINGKSNFISVIWCKFNEFVALYTIVIYKIVL